MTRPIIVIPTLTAGGAERVASILANEWCSYESVSVTVVLLFEEEIFYELDPRVRRKCLGLRARATGLLKMAGLLGALWSLRRTVKRERADFVLSLMHKYNVFCLVSLWMSKVPVFVSERDSPSASILWVIAALRRLTYRLARGAIAQSEAGRDFIRKQTGLREVTVLPNPLQVSSIRIQRRPEKIILNVGRLVPVKGHSELLRAFAQLECPGWWLVFCGDGPLRAELEALAVELGVAEAVQFVGTVTDVSAWYAKAGVFAFTSHFEGFPNALAEAMVAGVPVVSYDCPTGPAEMIQHGENGFLVPVGDIDRFAHFLDKLISDDKLADRFSANAKRIAAKVDAKVVARRYLDLCLTAASPTAQ